MKKIEEKLVESWGGSSFEEQTTAKSSYDSFSTSLSGVQALSDDYIYSLIKKLNFPDKFLNKSKIMPLYPMKAKPAD